MNHTKERNTNITNMKKNENQKGKNNTTTKSIKFSLDGENVPLPSRALSSSSLIAAKALKKVSSPISTSANPSKTSNLQRSSSEAANSSTRRESEMVQKKHYTRAGPRKSHRHVAYSDSDDFSLNSSNSSTSSRSIRLRSDNAKSSKNNVIDVDSGDENELDPAITALQPERIRYVITDGDKLQCFYLNLSRELKKSVDEIISMILSALDSIDDAQLLFDWQIIPQVELTEFEISQAKTAYKESSNIVNRQNGGVTEMKLLSHYFDGELSFLILSNSTNTHVEPIQRICSRPLDKKEPLYSSNRCREIVLHHCSSTGNRNTFPHHWNGFQYEYNTEYIDESVSHDNSDTHSIINTYQWIGLHKESVMSRKQRFKKIRACMNERTEMIHAVAIAREEEHKEAAQTIDAELTDDDHDVQNDPNFIPANKSQSKSKSKSAVTRKINKSQIASSPKKSKPSVPATTAVKFTLKVQHGSLATPTDFRSCKIRVNVWREIPRSCQSHFLALVDPMFQRYAHVSESGNDIHRAETLQRILDVPSLALIKNGRVRELMQSIEKHTSIAHLPMKNTNKNDYDMNTTQEKEINSTDSNNIITQSLSMPITPVNDTNVIESSERENNDDNISDTDSEVDSTTSDVDDFTDNHLESCIDRAVKIVREGGPRSLSRAARTLLQAPTVSVSELTVQQLKQLHPTPHSSESMQQIPADSALDIVSVNPSTLFKLLKRRVNNGSAPGPSGWTGAHLRLIAESASTEAKNGLCLLIKDICNGIFGGATRARLLSSVLQPIAKKGGPTAGVRPIAMGEVFVKLAAHYCMSLIEDQLPSLFPRIQYGVKRSGGSESAAQLTRAQLNHVSSKYADAIALKTDFKNAFNACSRKAIWDTLLTKPNTQHIWKMFYWSYSQSTPLLVFDRGNLYATIDSAEGVRQGDPFSAFCFALGVQPLYENCIKDQPDCQAVSIQDDLTLIGPSKQVFTAYDYIRQHAESYHLHLSVEKCAVYMPISDLNNDSNNQHRESVHQDCVIRQLQLCKSLDTLGVTIGPDVDVRSHCSDIIESHKSFFTALTHPSMPVQIANSLLRSCALPRLSYLARTVPPALFKDAAKQWDEQIIQCFMKLMEIDPTVFTDTGCHSTMNADDIRLQLQLPISTGGMGLRPMQSISHAAYFSSLASVMPDFVALNPNPNDNDDISMYESSLMHQQLKESQSELLTQCSPTIDDIQQQNNQNHAALNKNKKSYMKNNTTDMESRKEKSACLEILETSLSALWDRAVAFNQNGNNLKQTNFLEPQQLQREFTECIEKKLFSQLYHRSNDYRKVLLTSLSTSQCSDFINILPTEPKFNINNRAMQLAIRHRIGVIPFDPLINSVCACQKSTESQTSSIFHLDPDHFHSCKILSPSGTKQRHDSLVQVLMDLGRIAGFMAQREPQHHIRPDIDYGNHDNNKKRQSVRKERERDHADLLFIRYDMKLYVDMTVLRSTKSSLVNHQRDLKKSLIEPTLTIDRAAAIKKRKYAAIVATNGYKFFTFGMESYGGIGNEAMDLLKVFARHCQSMPEKEFLSYAQRRLSVCLQICNANLSLLAAQRLATSRLMLRERVSPTVSHKQVVPLDTQQLAMRAQSSLTAITYSQLDQQHRSHKQKQKFSFAHDVGIGRSDITRQEKSSPIILTQPDSNSLKPAPACTQNESVQHNHDDKHTQQLHPIAKALYDPPLQTSRSVTVSLFISNNTLEGRRKNKKKVIRKTDLRVTAVSA